MFKTKFVGYNRPGELYDPLIHSESIGRVEGAHTWIPGKGLRLDTERSYVRYQLAEAISMNGEFSVEVEGLHPGGPNHKLKIFSMNDRDGDISFSDMGMSTMYRGVNGNPADCIAFKAVFGSQSRIAEPDRSQRTACNQSARSIAHLFLESHLGQRFPSRCARWRRQWQFDLRPGSLGRRDVTRGVCLARIEPGCFWYRRRYVPGRNVPTPLDRQQAAALNTRQRIGLMFFERQQEVNDPCLDCSYGWRWR